MKKIAASVEINLTAIWKRKLGYQNIYKGTQFIKKKI
jgi:hypothetical protein